MDYDTSERKFRYTNEEQLQLMGEGDLRYFLQKTGPIFKDQDLINEGEYGSDYVWSEAVRDIVDGTLAELAKQTESSLHMRIAAFAHLQRELRILLNNPTPFDVGQFRTMCHEITRLSRLSGDCVSHR
jgi:hypothetical protein